VLTASSQFEAELKKRIAEAIAELRIALENRAVVQSHADYSFIAGKIDALKRVDEYCEDANKSINER